MYVEYLVRFGTSGNHTWVVPNNAKSVDVFLVGGGGGGSNSGGGGGYTKTFRGSGYVAPTEETWQNLPDGGRDGNAIAVTPGESIQIVVGAGGTGGSTVGVAGGHSQFKNSSYRAEGGNGGNGYSGGNGGSGGGGDGAGLSTALSDHGGNDGDDGVTFAPNLLGNQGRGQGHTTRDFGEFSGKRNAGGGSGARTSGVGGVSEYVEGSGAAGNGGGVVGPGGGGYGGGGGR